MTKKTQTKTPSRKAAARRQRTTSDAYIKQWFNRHWKFAVAQARARGVHDPEELVQNAVVSAWLRHDGTRKSFEKKLKTRLHFDPKSAYRRQARETLPPEEQKGPPKVQDPGIESAGLNEERWFHLEAALARLPETPRYLLVLRFWEDLSFAEIAQLTVLPEAVLRCPTSRAYGKLRRWLPADLFRGCKKSRGSGATIPGRRAEKKGVTE